MSEDIKCPWCDAAGSVRATSPGVVFLRMWKCGSSEFDGESPRQSERCELAILRAKMHEDLVHLVSVMQSEHDLMTAGGDPVALCMQGGLKIAIGMTDKLAELYAAEVTPPEQSSENRYPVDWDLNQAAKDAGLGSKP